jgi:peroxiredoxin
MFPQSIEVQMQHENAGDFFCILEDIKTPDMEVRRGPKEKWGIGEGKNRQIKNLTDGSEKPAGEWNNMIIECVGREIKVWVNGIVVNHGFECTAEGGQIALQAEGSEVEFRKVILTQINEISKEILTKMPSTAFDISPLLIGEPLADLKITNSMGQVESLHGLIKEKPAVIIFYRGNWCGNCITYFSQEIGPVISEIKKLGYNLIAISPDMPDTLLITSRKTNIDKNVFYSDANGSVSSSIGIAFQQNEKIRPRLLAYSGGKNTGFLPVPAVFVINTENKIIFEYINPNGPGHVLRMRGKFLITVLKGLNDLKP